MFKQLVASWRHVFKLDPQKHISDADLERICLSGTDGIVVGGTDGMTFDNTVDLLARVRRYEVPCVQEVSNQEAIVPGFDGYFIPIVLNAVDVRWLVGAQKEAVKQFGHMIPWDAVLAEGYVVLNADSKVAKLTKCDTELTERDVTAFAEVADRLMHLPLFYVEYSGMYGDVTMVRAARNGLTDAQLLYGGGIKTVAQAAEMAAVADTVIVGNCIYDNISTAIETVRAVKE